MKPETKPPTEMSRTAALVDDLPVPVEGPRTAPTDAYQGAARVQTAQRKHIELRTRNLDALLARDHVAHTVWVFV